MLAASIKDFYFRRASYIKKNIQAFDKFIMQTSIKLADMSEMSGYFSLLEPLTFLLCFSLQCNHAYPELRC